MRAAVLEKPRYIVLKEIEEPVVEKDEVIIAIEACGICRSDAKMWLEGQRDLRYPRVLGHEVAGVISKSGSEDYKVGEKVQIFPGVSCGECLFCKRGRDNLCSSIRILGFSYDGGFADSMKVPREILKIGGVNRLPQSLSCEEATLAEPLACCINSQDKTDVSQGDIVLILGAGTLGLLHAALAKSRGAEVLLAEVLPHRLEFARKINADRLVNILEEDLAHVVLEETDGRGADVIIPAFSEALYSYPITDYISKGGRLCLFSGLPNDQSVRLFDFNKVHYEEQMVVGSYGCTAKQNREAIKLLSTSLSLGWLVKEAIPLERIEEGLRKVASRESLKLVVEPALK